MKSVDVAIIGAGTAGLSALREVRRYTESFVIINDGPWGTMCARVGCMPSKALIEAANAFHRRRDYQTFGVRGGERLTVDAPAVLARVREVRDGMVKGALATTEGLGDRALSGPARLVGPNRIVVGSAAAEEEIQAARVILATGSRPVMPEAWKHLSSRLLTTDSLFEQATLPKRIAVLGLGAIGVEMAQALARLGCEVTGFEAKTMLAGLTDPRVNDALVDAIGADLTVHRGQEVKLVAEGDGLRVDAGQVSLVVDRALVALGRTPSLHGLGLETLGVQLDDRGRPTVDPSSLRIGDLPVFLVGDAGSDRSVQHEAADEGHIAGLNAGPDGVKSYRRRVPLNIVFTDPNVARVGKRLCDIEIEHVVGEASFADQGRAKLALRATGRLRVYAAAETGLLLGAELCVPDGEHLAHLLGLAIDRGTTVRELLRTPFYHPVIEEGLRAALRRAAEELPRGARAFELA